MLDISMTDEQAIKATVKEFILKEFLPGEDPAALTDTTALVTGHGPSHNDEKNVACQSIVRGNQPFFSATVLRYLCRKVSACDFDWFAL